MDRGGLGYSAQVICGAQVQQLQAKLKESVAEAARLKAEVAKAAGRAERSAAEAERQREDYDILINTVMADLPVLRGDIQQGLRSPEKATFMATLSKLRDAVRSHVAEREARSAEVASSRLEGQLRSLRASLSEKDSVAAAQAAALQDKAAAEARVDALEAELEAKQERVDELEEVQPPLPLW